MAHEDLDDPVELSPSEAPLARFVRRRKLTLVAIHVRDDGASDFTGGFVTHADMCEVDQFVDWL